MPAPDDLCDLPAHLLAKRLREREVTVGEVLEAHLARIERRNPALNAVVSLDVERARKLARKSQAALDRGAVMGPLHGVPMTLKDGHDVAGLRTTVGTADLDRLATTDGAVAARLARAGAIVTAHSNVAAWLADFQSENPVFGRTRNPWDETRTPGGSSGGAATAVATGLSPIEVGSDMTGSIRLPAHFTGIYGLKTTEHRVPLTGFYGPSDGPPRPVRILSCLGPMARDLDDLELVLKIISGPDDRDGDVPPVPLGAKPRVRLARLRLAFAPTLPGVTIASSIRERLEQVAARASAAGCHVEQRLPDLDWEAVYELVRDLPSVVTAVFEPRVEEHDARQSLAWYMAALGRRDGFITGWQAFFEKVDVLLLPSAATPAFLHCRPGASIEVGGETIGYWESGRLLTAINVPALPALAVPAGLDANGLPIGIQLVGPLWSEMRLLAIARELERAGVLPGFQPPPGE